MMPSNKVLYVPITLFGEGLFLLSTLTYLYGLYTTFWHGELPLLNWQVQGNILLGVLWIVAVIIGSGIVIFGFRNTCYGVAKAKKGYRYLLMMFAMLIVHVYICVNYVTLWYDKPLPLFPVNVEGNWIYGLIATPIVFLLLTFIVSRVNVVVDKFSERIYDRI
jgi:hypothetical protein